MWIYLARIRLAPHSQEEEITRDFILSGKADVTIIVCDATCLERNLNLALQTRCITDRAVLCVNLMDEARKKGIQVNIEELSKQLNMPVVGTSARSGKGLSALMDAVQRIACLPAFHGKFLCTNPKHGSNLSRS